jgi:hypothetical protein
MRITMLSSSIYTLLFLLAASVSVCIPLLVAAAENNITTNDLYAKINPTAALPGFNVEGGIVFSNFADTYNEGQLFLIRDISVVHEKPESAPVQFTSLDWCSDLTFSDINNSSLVGYAGHCVSMFLKGYANGVASSAQLPYLFSEGKFTYTGGMSAVFVEQQNVFEGQFHGNTDDIIWRYWDDGLKTVPMIGWEGHDEGDMHPNAATSSVSHFGQMTWMSVDEAAQLVNTSADEFTPETFKQVYKDTWITWKKQPLIILTLGLSWRLSSK